MDWMYVKDGKVPVSRPGSMLVCLVSATNMDGERYVVYEETGPDARTATDWISKNQKG